MTTRRTITDDGVSAATAEALRAAMQRLFEGKPQRTDGRLTKENLWREAQVSRATMNRATAILAQWDAHIAQHGALTAGEARRDEEISQLCAKLAEKTQECTLLVGADRHGGVAGPTSHRATRRWRRVAHRLIPRSGLAGAELESDDASTKTTHQQIRAQMGVMPLIGVANCRKSSGYG